MRAEERLKGGEKKSTKRGENKNPCQALWGIFLFPTTLVLLNAFLCTKFERFGTVHAHIYLEELKKCPGGLKFCKKLCVPYYQIWLRSDE